MIPKSVLSNEPQFYIRDAIFEAWSLDVAAPDESEPASRHFVNISP